MKEGYTRVSGEIVYVWVLGANASGCKYLVTNDEAGLETGGEKYMFIVDALDLFSEDWLSRGSLDKMFEGTTPKDLDKILPTKENK
jgi:hypothetical protein